MPGRARGRDDGLAQLRVDHQVRDRVAGAGFVLDDREKRPAFLRQRHTLRDGVDAERAAEHDEEVGAPSQPLGFAKRWRRVLAEHHADGDRGADRHHDGDTGGGPSATPVPLPRGPRRGGGHGPRRPRRAARHRPPRGVRRGPALLARPPRRGLRDGRHVVLWRGRPHVWEGSLGPAWDAHLAPSHTRWTVVPWKDGFRCLDGRRLCYVRENTQQSWRLFDEQAPPPEPAPGRCSR